MFTTETVSQHRGPVAWDDAAVLAAFVEGQARASAPVGKARGTIAAFDGMELADSFDWPASRTFSVDRRACFAREAR